MRKIRVGNDFWQSFQIKEKGVIADLLQVKDTVQVFAKVGDKCFEVPKEMVQIKEDGIITMEVKTELFNIVGRYEIIVKYWHHDISMSDDDRKQAVNFMPFVIVGKTEMADSSEDIPIVGDIIIGLKGDAFTYDDFTPEQIEDLKRPAIEAGEIAIQKGETAKTQGELAETQGNVAQAQGDYANEKANQANTAAQNATNATIEAQTATQEATTAASLADTARLAIQDDLELKANHGYEINPKTLKQVDDSLVQLAGDVNPKVDFIIPKNNLLNRNTELPNNIVNQTNGNIETHATHSASDWIAIDPSTNYYSNAISRLGWYDENRVYISGELSPQMPITSPSNAKYIRVSYIPGNVYLVKGSSAVPYEAFKFLFSLLEVNTSQLAGDLQPAQTANFRLKSDLIAKEDTSFFSKGKNLFNKATVNLGKYVNQNSGYLGSSISYWASDYIPVIGNTNYFASSMERLAWYDSNKVFISGLFSSEQLLTSPDNAKFLRFSVPSSVTNKDTFQLEQGSSATSFEPYYHKIEREAIAIYIDGVYRDIATKLIADDLDILERNKNLFIQEAITPGKYINWTNGFAQTSLEYSVSDWIPIQPNATYTNSLGRHYALYDSNKVFISGASGGYNKLINTPSNAAFARISIPNNLISHAQFEAGSEETSYVKGGYIHKPYIIPQETPVTEIVMPPKYIAVVGTPLQIFYHGLIKAINPYKYNLQINCARGKDFRRYWEFTPQASDIGTHTLTLSLCDDANSQISTGSTQIEVVEFVQNPAVKKNILTVGDSLNNGAGDWGDAFAKQVVDGTNILSGLSPISNIDFVGEDGVAPKQYTGQGGWNWSNYNLAPNPATADIWVYATHDKDASDQESLWSDANSNIWQLETIEPTRLKFKRYGGHTAAMPASPNALIHNLNAVHTATINYTSIQVAEQNPFWNASTSEVDFVNWFSNKYPTKHSAGEGIDACFVMLGWNGAVYGKLSEADWDAYIVAAKTFIDNLHSDYPSCKVYVMGLQYPSLNGGLGNNYGARANYYSELWSVIQSVQSLNKAYKTLCNDAAYSSFCRFINISGQFDSEFNMPYSTTPVNLRSSITERRGNNGVHPAAEGYMQISDAAIRMLIKEFCQ